MNFSDEEILERIAQINVGSRERILAIYEQNIKDFSGIAGLTEEELRASSAELLEAILKPFDAVAK